MDSRKELTLRLEQYKTILKRNPCHLETLERCLGEQENLTDYEKIFLHIYAPVVTSYAEWVLDEAAALGKKRLYFLARDGWLLQSVAEVLAEEAGYCFDMKYLKISRYSLRMAEYGLLGDKCLDMICVGGIDISFQKIMKRAALTEEEALHVAEVAGWKEKRQIPLNYTQIQNLKNTLRETRVFLEYVNRHSKESYDNTIGYLRQEGMMEAVPYGLVDSGWVGTIQRSLQHLVSHALGREKEMDGFYFGLYELPKEVRAEKYHGYYIVPNRKIKRKTRFSICLFETLFSSPDGMTLGYEKNRDGYFSIESKNKNPNGNIIRQNKKMSDLYAAIYREISHTKSCINREQSLIRNILSAFRKKDCFVEQLLTRSMGVPTRLEAQLLGNLLFCDDVLELQMQKVAADWNMEEIQKQRFVNKLLIKLNRKKGTLHESGWPEGSITKAGGDIAGNLRQERMYKYFMYIRKAL